MIIGTKKPVRWDDDDDDGFFADDLHLTWFADDAGGYFAHGDHGERLRISAVNDWAVFDSDTELRATGQTFTDDCTAAMMEAEAVASAYFDHRPVLPVPVTADGVRSAIEKFHPALGEALKSLTIGVGPPDAPMFKLADFSEAMGLVLAAEAGVNRVAMWFEGGAPQLLTDDVEQVLALVEGSIAKLTTVLQLLGIDPQQSRDFDGPLSSASLP
jgi:hypothetical protein